MARGTGAVGKVLAPPVPYPAGRAALPRQHSVCGTLRAHVCVPVSVFVGGRAGVASAFVSPSYGAGWYPRASQRW